MNKAGKILSFLGAVNVGAEKVRLLHPIGFLTLPIWIVLAFFVCLFTEENLLESFKDNYCIW